MALKDHSQEPATIYAADGTEYTATPWTIADYAALEKYVHDNLVTETIQAVGRAGTLTHEARGLAIAHAVAKPIDVQAAAQTVDGSAFMLHRALRKHHPQVKRSDIFDLFGDRFGEAIEMVALASGAKAGAEPKGSARPLEQAAMTGIAASP